MPSTPAPAGRASARSRRPPTVLRSELLRQPVVRVVIEACSPAGWIDDLGAELTLPCLVANTSGAAWLWRNLKRKADRDDAPKLASPGELPTVAAPAMAAREWKSLTGPRKRLVGARVRGQNRVRVLPASQGLPAPAATGPGRRRAWPASASRRSPCPSAPAATPGAAG